MRKKYLNLLLKYGFKGLRKLRAVQRGRDIRTETSRQQALTDFYHLATVVCKVTEEEAERIGIILGYKFYSKLRDEEFLNNFNYEYKKDEILRENHQG
jgi:hypothetical protein